MALLEHPEVEEVRLTPQEDLVPPAPPEGLDSVLYEHDERAARADLRRQIAAMELALARLFGSAFPRKGIEFAVAGLGGPRLLSVDELEQVRDGLAWLSALANRWDDRLDALREHLDRTVATTPDPGTNGARPGAEGPTGA